MAELKQKLVDRLIEVLKADIASGDDTVLDEILMKCDNQLLIQSLPEEEWSKYSALLNDDHIKGCIEEAGRILSQNDELEGEEDNILQQIKLIAEFAETNPDKYIDWVDGVVVWSKVENTYTCEEFLEEINW